MNKHRDIILQRVESALRRGATEGFLQPSSRGSMPEPPALPEALVRSVHENDREALWKRFEEKIKALGDGAMRFRDSTALRGWLQAEIHRRKFTRGIADVDALNFLMLEGAEDKNPRLGNARLGDLARREDVFQAQFAITLVDFAIAETGTLGIATGAGRSRLSSLAPETHYAILPLSCLLPDLWDALDRHWEYQRGESIAWITGSSRTADIEGILIHGAHGPKELCVLALESC